MSSKLRKVQAALEQTQWERNGNHYSCSECHNSKFQGHSKGCSIGDAVAVVYDLLNTHRKLKAELRSWINTEVPDKLRREHMVKMLKDL